MTEALRVYIGYDPREQAAYRVCEASMRRHASRALDIQPLILADLIGRGLYTRPTKKESGKYWDVISQARMSTEFALTRFLVPELAGFKGWALFCDCDFLWRDDVAELFAFADPRYAAMVVPHLHVPAEKTKMDCEEQTAYTRKNWSSCVLWNCAHLLHAGQRARVDRWPGLWLHQFRWLGPRDLGSLPEAWNWLEGVSSPAIDPCAVHYTRGCPDFPGYEHSAYADEWRAYLAAPAAGLDAAVAKAA